MQIVRRLMLLGIGIFMLVSASEWLTFHQHAGLVLACRSALALCMLGLWWLARHARSSIKLMVLVWLELLLISSGACLVLFFDLARLPALLNALILLVMISAPSWANARQFAIGTLMCLLPALVALTWLDVDRTVWHDYGVYLCATVAAAYGLWWQRMRAADDSAGLRAELQQRAISDPMTGVLNRAGWNKQAAQALATRGKSASALSLLYIDLDRFKTINDRYGHSTGDAMIEYAATLIRTKARQGDLAARLGGEEFALLLVRADQAQALAVAERIRVDFQNGRSPAPGTLSIGVAQCLPGESLSSLMSRADGALLAAKRNGRNRVEQADSVQLAPAGGAVDGR